MRLILGQNVDELVEVSDTAASKELQQFVVAVPRMNKIRDVLSLRPRDTPISSQFCEKQVVGIKKIKQMNTIDIQRFSLSFIQRSVITAVYNQHND